MSLKGSWFKCHVPVAAIVIWIERFKSDWSDARVSGWTHSGSGRRIASYWTDSSNRTNKVNEIICYFEWAMIVIVFFFFFWTGKPMFIGSSWTIQSKNRFIKLCPRIKMDFGRPRNVPSKIWPSFLQHQMHKTPNPLNKMIHK